MKTFTSEQNPLDKNNVCVYENMLGEKNLIFQVDKRNFENDNEFKNAVKFIISSLNSYNDK